MDLAAFGQLEIVQYLHLNRSEGCDLALALALMCGYFEVVKYLVENALGTDRIQEATIAANEKGHLEIVSYLEDHVLVYEKIRTMIKQQLSNFSK